MTFVPILATGQATTLSFATGLVKLRLSEAMSVEISAHHRLGTPFRPGQGGQQHARQDGDDHQQLDQREAAGACRYRGAPRRFHDACGSNPGSRRIQGSSRLMVSRWAASSSWRPLPLA